MASAVILSQYWKACTKVMPFIPPLAMPKVTMTPRTMTPIHSGPPEGHLEGQPRPLELGQEVEAADDEDDAGGGTAEERRLQPALGEVRNRVGAEAPQRRGHGDQEDQVTGGVPDGVPEGAEPFEHGQSGNAQERRRREVLPRDGGGIEERRYRAGGHHEVRRRAGDTDTADTDDGGHDRHGHNGRDGGRLRHCSFSSSTNRCSRRSARRTYQ